MSKNANSMSVLKERGYQSALAGEPCEAPTSTELGRGAWEQGWRAGNAERALKDREPSPADPLGSLVVIVVGGNQGWGKAPLLEDALKYAQKPKQYIAYVAHPETTVDPIDGSLCYPVGFRPKVIARKGLTGIVRK